MVIILCVAAALTAGECSAQAQTTPIAPNMDREQAVGIMVRLGELYHQQALLKYPEASARELLEIEITIAADKHISRKLAANARRLAAQFGGDLEEQYLRDAEAIEAEADAKAERQRRDLINKMRGNGQSAVEIGSEIDNLKSQFWATQYGMDKEASWTAEAKRDKSLYAAYCVSGKDGLLRRKAGLMHAILWAVEKKAKH